MIDGIDLIDIDYVKTATDVCGALIGKWAGDILFWQTVSVVFYLRKRIGRNGKDDKYGKKGEVEIPEIH